MVGRSARVLSALTLCAACASSPRSPTALEEQAAQAPVAPLGDGAEPPDLVVTIRVPNLERDYPKFQRLVPPVGDLASLAEVGLPQFAEVLLGEKMARIVDLASPIDVTISGPDEAQTTVFSLHVPELDSARRALEPDFGLVPQAGATRLPLRSADKAGGLYADGFECELWPHRGTRSGRLLCSSTGSVAPSYAAYLLKRASEPRRSESLMVVEVARRVLREALDDPELRIPADNPGDQVFLDTFYALIRDVDGIGMDVALESNAVEIGLEVALGQSESVLSSILLSHASDRALSDVFWDAPADALVGLQWEGMQPGARADEVLGLFRKFNETLPEADFDPKGREELAVASAGLWLTGGPFLVFAGADLDAAARSAQEYLAASGDATDALVKARSALSGWMLLGAPEPLEGWVASTRRLMHVMQQYNRVQKPPVPKPSARNGAPDAARGFSASPQTAELTFLSEVAVTAKEGLPPGTVHFVYETVPNPAYQPPPAAASELPARSVSHWFLFSKASHAWLCTSDVEELCRERSRRMWRGGAGTLRESARSELAELHALRSTGAGFISAAGLVWATATSGTRAEVREAKDALGALNTLPGAGRTRIPLMARSTATAGARSGRTRFSIKLSNEELLSWLGALGAFSDDGGGP